MGKKYVQEEFLGEESLGEKYMGEKSVGEKSLGENRVRRDAGFRAPFLRSCYAQISFLIARHPAF
jgi:hypothetical protein